MDPAGDLDHHREVRAPDVDCLKDISKFSIVQGQEKQT